MLSCSSCPSLLTTTSDRYSERLLREIVHQVITTSQPSALLPGLPIGVSVPVRTPPVVRRIARMSEPSRPVGPVLSTLVVSHGDVDVPHLQSLLRKRISEMMQVGLHNPLHLPIRHRDLARQRASAGYKTDTDRAQLRRLQPDLDLRYVIF